MELRRRKPFPKQPPSPAADHRQDAHDIPVHGIGADEIRSQLPAAEQLDVFAGPALQRQDL